jgi:nitrite reductase/ring-hydroxylating ferredoxin subunit
MTTLRITFLAALLGLILLLAGAIVMFALPRPKYEQLGSIEDYPARDQPYDLLQERGYYLVNSGAEIMAINPNAPRKAGCRVYWDEELGRFSDPCFGTIFNLAGEYLNGPPSPPLGRYPVRVEGHMVWVSTNTSAVR